MTQLKDIKELKDFKSTPYYEYYTKQIDEYCIDLIKKVMNKKDNEVKYTWNDVLKEVYSFVNGDLREFKDKLEINPYKEEVDEEKLKRDEEILDKEARQLIGMN